ncbi:caspase family protein [Chitinophaga lutea]
MQERKFYAAFVGINAYPEGALSGCVKDVLELDLFLREWCAQQEGLTYTPVYYLAPNEADAFRLEAHAAAAGRSVSWDAPTYFHLRERLFGHFETAAAGDVCLFYYSGHGSQTPAPPEFRRRMLETLVCVDSRDPNSPAARDLVDKELAYLLWKTFARKTGVHTVLIMDCCHSGNNTRDYDGEFRFRFVPSSRSQVPFADLLGHGDAEFYTLRDGYADFRIPSYVHLAACRDDEKAQESANGGLFTGKLVEALRNGGASASYRELLQGLALTVGNRAERQTPVAFSQQDIQLDQPFLSTGMRPYRPFFNVRHNARESKWKLAGGAMHGLQTGDLMRVSDGVREVETPLLEVQATSSVLAPEGFDEDSQQVKAVRIRSARPALKVSAPQDGAFPPGVTGMVEIVPAHAAFEIRALEDGAWGLFRTGEGEPLFRREPDAGRLLAGMNVVGNWMAALELQQTSAAISRSDLSFEWNLSAPSILTPEGPQLRYNGDEMPVFGLRISLAPGTKLSECYVKALYLGSRFSILTSLLRDDDNRLAPGHPLELTLAIGDQTYRSIPVGIDDAYARRGVAQINDYLKIIVSTRPFSVDSYRQDSLPPDEGQAETTRDLVPPKTAKSNQPPEWTVFTFRIQCHR